jgi:hypothetical protein
MMRRITCLAGLTLGVAFIAVVASAQDITGTWDVRVESPQGNVTTEATFAQDGDQIVGTLARPVGPISFPSAGR